MKRERSKRRGVKKKENILCICEGNTDARRRKKCTMTQAK